MKLLTHFKVGAILTALKDVARPKQYASTIHFDSSRLCEKFRTPKHVVGGQEGWSGIVVTSFRRNAERGFFFAPPVIRASREQDAFNRCYGCNGHTAPETSAVSLWAFIMQQARVRWHQTPLRPVKLKENIQPLKSSAVAVFLLTLKIYLNRQELPKWGSGGGISSFSFSFYNHEAH